MTWADEHPSLHSPIIIVPIVTVRSEQLTEILTVYENAHKSHGSHRISIGMIINSLFIQEGVEELELSFGRVKE